MASDAVTLRTYPQDMDVKATWHEDQIQSFNKDPDYFKENTWISGGKKRTFSIGTSKAHDSVVPFDVVSTKICEAAFPEGGGTLTILAARLHLFDKIDPRTFAKFPTEGKVNAIFSRTLALMHQSGFSERFFKGMYEDRFGYQGFEFDDSRKQPHDILQSVRYNDLQDKDNLENFCKLLGLFLPEQDAMKTSFRLVPIIKEDISFFTTPHKTSERERIRENFNAEVKFDEWLAKNEEKFRTVEKLNLGNLAIDPGTNGISQGMLVKILTSQRFPNLKVLNLSGNCLYNIDEIALRDFANLQVLDLSNNQFREIPLSLPDGIDLNLSGNPLGIPSVPAGQRVRTGTAFSRLSSRSSVSPEPCSLMISARLRELDLSGCGLRSIVLDTTFEDSNYTLAVLDVTKNKSPVTGEVRFRVQRVHMDSSTRKTSLDPDNGALCFLAQDSWPSTTSDLKPPAGAVPFNKPPTPPPDDDEKRKEKDSSGS